VRSWAKVAIWWVGWVWAQEEGPLRFVVYEGLLERYFKITSWATPASGRPDTVRHLRAEGYVPLLRSFPKLEALYLSEVEELDLRDLVSQIQRYCPRLSVLALEDCDLEDASPIAELRLKGLLLDDNPIDNLDFTARLTELRYLGLARLPVRDLRFLERLPGLEALDLSETPIENLAPLEKLTQLRMISLFRCVGIRDFSPLFAAPQLEVLNISHTQPEAAQKLLTSIGRFPQLKVLQAQGVIRGGASLAAMATLSQLEELTLGQNPGLTDLSFVRLLKRLLYLDVHACQIRDLSPLAGLPSLVKLSAGKNQITSLAPLVSCPRLAYLYLYENPIQDWEKLLEMPALTYVMLSRRDLSPERLSQLRQQLRKKGVTVEAP